MQKSNVYAVNIENLEMCQILDLLLYIGSLGYQINAPISLKDVENRKENNIRYLVFIEDENLLMFYTQNQLDEIKTDGNFTLLMRDNKIHIFQAIVNKNTPKIANLYYTVDRSIKGCVYAHIYLSHKNKTVRLFSSVPVSVRSKAQTLEQVKDYLSLDKNIIHCIDNYGFHPLKCNITLLN